MIILDFLRSDRKRRLKTINHSSRVVINTLNRCKIQRPTSGSEWTPVEIDSLNSLFTVEVVESVIVAVIDTSDDCKKFSH